MNKATEDIEKWLSENKMTPNTKKSHIVNIKRKLNGNLLDSPLEPVELQRDLGLIVHQNLNRSKNCQIRSKKVMNALFQVKRNLTSACHWKVKLNACTGYVVPIATYASQTWWPSKENLQEFEQVQHYATKWILGLNINYRNRHLSLRILPLSLYVEMHDLFFLLSMRTGDYDFEENLDYIASLGNKRQNRRGEYWLYKSRLMKTDDNFF